VSQASAALAKPLPIRAEPAAPRLRAAEIKEARCVTGAPQRQETRRLTNRREGQGSLLRLPLITLITSLTLSMASTVVDGELKRERETDQK
jgi:hypothetical protein